MNAGDGFMAEAVKATGMFETFEPENDPEGWHDFGGRGPRRDRVLETGFVRSGFRLPLWRRGPGQSRTTMRVLTIMLARDW